MNFTDILGSMLNQGMTPSSSGRLNNSLGGGTGSGGSSSTGGGIGDLLNQLGGATGGSGGGGGLGDLLNSLGGGSGTGGAPSSSGSGSSGSSGGGLLGSLAEMAGAAMKSGPGGGTNPLVTGGLAALAGAIFGGGGKGALGGTALAVIGSLAMKALAGRSSSSSSSQLMAGLRAPENDHEVREVENVAELTVRAMLNAAKADGRIDREEIRHIIGKASEDGLTQAEQDFISAEIKKPMETEALVRAVPNEQVAAQVYAASLLAIEVDTDKERRYLQTLASDLRLDSSVVSSLHSALGVA